MRSISKFARRSAYYLLAWPVLHRFWLFVERLADAGLNRGNVDHPGTSGERCVLRAIPPPHVVVDVGANVGDYTREAIRCWPAVQVIAVDPAPSALQRLPSLSNITPVEAALVAEGGSAFLIKEQSGAKTAAVYEGNEANLADTDLQPVRAMTLDQLAREQNICDIDLLKIDVEGTELDVLRGAHELLRNGHIRSIQFEFGYANLRRGVLLCDLLAALPPHQLYRVLRWGLVKTDYSPRLEHYLTANYFVRMVK